MPDEPADVALAGSPAATRERWRDAVRAVLAKTGADPAVDPEVLLSSSTYDEITVRPLYTPDDAPDLGTRGTPGAPPFVRGATADAASGDATGWDVRAWHADPDPARTKAAALEDLERGATSLWLVLGDAGLPVDGLGAALDGVYLDLAPLVLDAGAATVEAAAALRRLLAERGVDPAQLQGSLGADPIGARARSGAAADLAALGRLVNEREAFGAMRLMTVDATVYAGAGASDAQEVGVTSAVGVAYLRALTDAGLSVDEALAAMEFRWAVTAEQFPSIAKLRAARLVWDRVAELSGAAPTRRGQYQHAVTSAAMLTRRDPWVNLLRTTIGCFAAAVGGADAITVLPFDAAIGRTDPFARRIARNTASILHDESSLARVVDPAGGSSYVEALTDQLAQRAWDVFSLIERAGGAVAALDDGTIGTLLAGVRERRAADIAHRRVPITGVSEFADVAEAPVVRPARRVPDDQGTGAGLLPQIRYAQEFEALRDRVDDAAAAARPRVFLATIGPAAAFSARAGFAVNLFAAAGIECVAGPVEEYPADTPVACLCSSDALYATEAASAAAQLRAAGAQFVWIAGRADYAGVDGCVFAGCDALAALRTTIDVLEVP